MFNFVFDRKSFALLVAGLMLAGALLFFGGLLVGVSWGLPSGGQVAYTRPRTVQVKEVRVPVPCPEPEPAAPAPLPAEPEPPPPQIAEEAPPVRTMTASYTEPEPAPDGAYSVQVGAFRSRENSEAVLRDLASRGYEPYLVEMTTRRRNVLHTVRIGRYATRQEATQAATDLRQREQLDTIVQRNRTDTPL